jgi:hypothetical protein
MSDRRTGAASAERPETRSSRKKPMLDSNA